MVQNIISCKIVGRVMRPAMNTAARGMRPLTSLRTASAITSATCNTSIKWNYVTSRNMTLAASTSSVADATASNEGIEVSDASPLMHAQEAEAQDAPLDSANVNDAPTESPTINALQVDSTKAAEFDAIDKTDTAAIESFLGAMASERDFGTAFYAYNKLKEANVALTSLMYSCIFEAGRRLLRTFETRQLLGSNNVVSYRGDSTTNTGASTTEGYDSHNSPVFEQLNSIVTDMRQANCEFTESFYDNLAGQLSATGQAGLLINIASAMEERQVQPSITFYNRMLYCLPRSGLDRRATLLFDKLVATGLANQFTYSVRIGGMVANKQLQQAQVLFEAMKNTVGLDRPSCNSIINGYLNANQLSKAFEVLNLMTINAQPAESTSSQEIYADSYTINTFMSYCYRSGDLLTLNKILDMFKSFKYPTSDVDYACLIKAYSRVDGLRAVNLIKELVANESATNPIGVQAYNAVLNAFIDRRVSDITKLSIGQVMIKESLPLDPQGLAALLSNASRDIVQLIARMEAKGQRYTSVTVDLVMRHLRWMGDHQGIVKVYEYVSQRDMSGVETSSHVYTSMRNHYLSALLKLDRIEDVKRVITSFVRIRHRFNDNIILQVSQRNIEVPGWSDFVAQRMQFLSQSNNSNGFTSSNDQSSFSPSMSYKGNWRQRAMQSRPWSASPSNQQNQSSWSAPSSRNSDTTWSMNNSADSMWSSSTSPDQFEDHSFSFASK